MEKQQKQKISSELGNIVKSAIVINEEIGRHFHTSGILTLESKNYVVHESKGFLAEYQHKGKLYQVNIHEIRKR